MTSRIMVVEDETIIARDVQNTLASFGYEMCPRARSGEEAIRVARDAHPDLILMDIHLGSGMDGIEAAAQILKVMDVPIVFLSAFADQATQERVKAVQPHGYVIKPFDDADLQLAVSTALKKHGQE